MSVLLSVTRKGRVNSHDLTSGATNGFLYYIINICFLASLSTLPLLSSLVLPAGLLLPTTRPSSRAAGPLEPPLLQPRALLLPPSWAASVASFLTACDPFSGRSAPNPSASPPSGCRPNPLEHPVLSAVLPASVSPSAVSPSAVSPPPAPDPGPGATLPPVAAPSAPATAPPVSPLEVSVRILTHFRPTRLSLRGPASHTLEASQDSLILDNHPTEQPLSLPSAMWTVLLPGQAPRHYPARLTFSATAGQLEVIAYLPLERYVARVLTGETLPGTPPAALQAQAVVVRSYILAQPPRHGQARACDLAHCQVLYGQLPAAHLQAASHAAQSTEGQVLRLSDGQLAATPFHAACAGQTAAPSEIFGGSDQTGAASVPDPGCPRQRWQTSLPRAQAQAALVQLLPHGPGWPAVRLEALRLERGQGGYVVRVVEAGTGRYARGDALARALDQAAGWGKVRSAHLWLEVQGQQVRLRGRGVGHGVGLCQAGAAAASRRGESYHGILQHYFPLAHLGRLDRPAQGD